MKEIFLEYAKKGSMTVDEVAAVVRRKPSTIRNNSGPGKLIPRLPGYPIRFDPMAMISVFCADPKEATIGGPPLSSLTIERHKAAAKPHGGYRKCL